MAGKFKKSTSYFDVAAEKAEERQQKIVESASESQKPAPQVRKAGRPKKGAEGASERLVQLSVYVPESYRKRLKQAALEGAFGPCYVEGPISLDLALSRESAQIKGYESP